MTLKTLEDALIEFHREMLAKFYDLRVLAKHVGDPVTQPGGLDRLRVNDAEDHLWAEIEERFPPHYSAPVLTDSEKRGEDIDVANCAFLDWYARRVRQ